METLTLILQTVIALGIFNVWFIRFNQPTGYRGAGATSMPEEFRAYGLSRPQMYLIGATKVLLAVLLLIGLWVPELTGPAAAIMAVLMLGAVAMHFKVHDPVIRALPAFAMLVMSLLLVLQDSSW